MTTDIARLPRKENGKKLSYKEALEKYRHLLSDEPEPQSETASTQHSVYRERTPDMHPVYNAAGFNQFGGKMQGNIALFLSGNNKIYY